jgi:exopolysaccharide biosynthesis polyprenyl glycosylphosphotransferase
MPKWWRSNYTLLHLVLDVFLTELALFLAGLLVILLPIEQAVPTGRWGLSLAVYGVVAIVWAVAFLLQSIYAPSDQRAVDQAQSILVAVTLATLTLAAFLFFAFPSVSRLHILIFYLLDLIFLIGSRLTRRRILRLLNQPRYARRRVLILGAGEIGRDVARMVQRCGWAGLEPVGFLDDKITRLTEVEGLPVLGPIDEVEHYVKEHDVDEIIVALPIHAYDRFFRLVAGLRQLPAQVRIVPDHIKSFLFRARLEELAGIAMITMHKGGLSPFERQVKRAFDLFVGTLLFILALPLMALIALAIRLDSPGPILFRQQRVGEGGKFFLMYKFRSMVEDAEDRQAETLSVDEDGYMIYKHPEDPRVTRVGRIIRRTSLDEVPQLLNVLKGEMSLVGPRPELPWIVESYEAWQFQRFAVPQGITGWWQVNGRSDKPMHLHTEEDLFYIQNYSLLLDVQILWKTAGAVVKRRGAY